MATIRITDRRWANKARTLVILTVCDPNKPGQVYETAPCPNTTPGEEAAIDTLLHLREAAGLDYPGRPEAIPETLETAV